MITLFSSNSATALSTSKVTTSSAATDTFADQLQEYHLKSDKEGEKADDAAKTQPTAPHSPYSSTFHPADTLVTSPAVLNFIEWQGAQPNPLGQGTIAEVWVKQGITDPMKNPVLISQAQVQLNRAEQRIAINPNYVAEWSGDWKSQMAITKAHESQRQSLLAASDALAKVTVGGSMVG